MGSATPPWVGWLLLLLCLGVVLYVLGQLISFAPTASRSQRKLAATLLEVTEGEAEGWEQALDLARAALNGADLRQALWLMHRLLLLRLDQADAICFDRAKTNQAYLRECPLGHPQSPLLQSLTEQYENVIYGHKPVPAGSVEKLLDQVSRL